MKPGSSPPFQHTPYDGSSQPFTVGLKPVGEEAWLEPDPFLGAHLAEKERLFQEKREDVFRAEADTDAAQEEVLRLIADHLRCHHGTTHRPADGGFHIPSAGRRVSLDGRPALLTASRLVQEDLVVMRAGPDGYRLVAASLCFPSSWSLAEKFGRSMTGIHDNVPGFNGTRMGQTVARLFENLKAGQLVGRFNWSLYPDGELHHPRPKRIREDLSESALARLFLRVERQTLRRLPGSGDILFTIKIHHDPLAALQDHEERAALAAGLRRQLLDLDADQLAYKGLTGTRDALAEALERRFG
ncbi:heme-dependent oxidative N-demethylase family protein [Roseibium salinum]|uniref:DUF3445 domain-containing protein n=1 Tax=Roseibium salinum TaxID=1604349 RepID=A0ABT3R8B8_9HYPH|nr:DUF3445 domain-containing protein [Roseibium sp. DSM 29163]MCX2725341.1 DUF3445 domain-containing protein [Roseibium sp. DSM 29163]